MLREAEGEDTDEEEDEDKASWEDEESELDSLEELDELTALEEAEEASLEDESPAGTTEVSTVVLFDEGSNEVAPSLLLLLEEKLVKVRTPKSRANGLRNEKAFMGGVSCRNYFKPAFYHTV
jgi:hypothetical protein